MSDHMILRHPHGTVCVDGKTFFFTTWDADSTTYIGSRDGHPFGPIRTATAASKGKVGAAIWAAHQQATS